MKSISTIVVLLVLGVGFYLAAYTVQESEQVVIVRLGKVMGGAVDEPGLHFKWPIVDDVRRFEKRWLEWDGDANQITTRDKRYIYIDVFARWRISDPLVFIETLRDEHSAQGRLDDIIDNATRNVVANHNLIELIRTTNRELKEADDEARLTGRTAEVDSAVPAPVALDPLPQIDDADAGPSDAGMEEPVLREQPAPSELVKAGPVAEEKRPNLYSIEVGREKLTQLILEKASKKAAQLGIEVKDVQFKRINYIESVQTKVFDRMISERKRVAEAFRSQGRGRSAEILGQTEKELKKIQSEAYRKAQEIMGEADARAAAIYAQAYKRDPELYNFLKTLESYQETIDEKSWLLLSTDADYAKHLKSMKKIPR
ncbi:MAG: protease modulator HflC [Deltaproteobacteria bacterium]|nr:protease modulator HflC [Deltaproteobacteria bacterium]